MALSARQEMRDLENQNESSRIVERERTMTVRLRSFIKAWGSAMLPRSVRTGVMGDNSSGTGRPDVDSAPGFPDTRRVDG